MKHEQLSFHPSTRASTSRSRHETKPFFNHRYHRSHETLVNRIIQFVDNTGASSNSYFRIYSTVHAMATTSRRSRPAATPTRTPVRIPARTQPRALPSYQPPSAPLNARAIQSLNTLPTKQDLAGLKSHGRKAPERLTEAVADINEQLLVRREDLAKARARADRAAEQGDGEDGAERREWAAGEEAQARVMEDAVKELTGKIEEAVRAGIDAQARVEAGERAIEQVASQVARGEGRLEAGATQSTLGASQFRSGRLEDGDDGEAGSQGGGMGAMALLQLKAQEFEAEYARQSMRMRCVKLCFPCKTERFLTERSRYASHNDYASFKKSLHQAQHSGRDEAAPPLPHARTWFPSENGDDDVSDTADRDATGAQSSRRGTSKRAGRAAAADPIQDDSESDVETTAVNVNIKCPLTLLPMKDPVTSTKCPHSFEREAILDMMKHTGSMRPRGTPQLNAMKCPCCEVVSLTCSWIAPRFRCSHSPSSFLTSCSYYSTCVHDLFSSPCLYFSGD